MDLIKRAVAVDARRMTSDEIEHAVCEAWRDVAQASTAAKALIVHKARQEGIPQSRLSVLLSVNAQRISQLDIYGAWVLMHHETGHALHSLAPERRMRPYLEDARRIRSGMREIAEEAEQMVRKGIISKADPMTGELLEIVPKHPEQRKEDDYKSVGAAAASIRNVARRVTCTIDVVGRWSNWADGSHPDEIESFRGTARWLVRVLQGALDELDTTGAGR